MRLVRWMVVTFLLDRNLEAPVIHQKCMSADEVIYDVNICGKWNVDSLLKDYNNSCVNFSKKANFLEWKPDWMISCSPNGIFMAIVHASSVEIRNSIHGFKKTDYFHHFSMEMSKSRNRRVVWSSDSKFLLILFESGHGLVFSQDCIPLHCFDLRESSNKEKGRLEKMKQNLMTIIGDDQAVFVYFLAEDTIYQQKLWKYRIFYLLKDGHGSSAVFDSHLEDGEMKSSFHICSHHYFDQNLFVAYSAWKTHSGKLAIVGASRPEDSSEFLEDKLFSFDVNFFSGNVKCLKSMTLPKQAETRHSKFSSFLQYVWPSRSNKTITPYAMEMNSCGKKAAIISHDLKSVIIVDLVNTKIYKQYSIEQLVKDPTLNMSSVQLWSDNEMFLAFSDCSVRLFDIEDLHCLFEFKELEGTICSFSVDDSWKKCFSLKMIPSIYKFPTSQDGCIDLQRGRKVESSAVKLGIEDNSSMMKKLLKAVLYPISFITDTLLWNFDSRNYIPCFEQLTVYSYELMYIYRTNPREHYLGKIEAQNYSEALTIAEKYGFNSDEVYKGMWMSSEVSEISIKEILSKISDKIWILKACLERYVELPSTLRMLLFFCQGLVENDVTNLMDSSESSKELLRLGKSVSTSLRLLDTIEEIIEKEKNVLVQNFYSFYRDFQSQDLDKLCVKLAREGKIETVSVIFKRHFDEICGLRYVILESFPENIDPNLYLLILPSIQNDFECFEFSSSPPGSSFDRENNIQFPLPSHLVVKWYEDRIFSVDKKTGLVNMLESWIKVAKLKTNTSMQQISNLVTRFSAFLYQVPHAASAISLEDFEMIPENEISKLYLLHSTEQTVINVYNEKIKITNHDETIELITTLFEKNRKACLVLLKFMKRVDLIEECFFSSNYNYNDALCILKELKVEGCKEKEAFLESLISLKNLFCKYEIDLSLKDIRYYLGKEMYARSLITRSVQSVAKKSDTKDSEWLSLFNDLLLIRKTVCSGVELKFIATLFVESLLNCGKFSLASSILYPNGQKGAKILSENSILQIVRQVSFSLIDEAKSLDDPMLKKAKDCLLVANHMTPIQRDLDFLDGLLAMSEYQSQNLLPSLVRKSANKLYFILNIIHYHDSLYQKPLMGMDIAKKFENLPLDFELQILFSCLEKGIRVVDEFSVDSILDLISVYIIHSPILNHKHHWRILNKAMRTFPDKFESTITEILSLCAPYSVLQRSIDFHVEASMKFSTFEEFIKADEKLKRQLFAQMTRFKGSISEQISKNVTELSMKERQFFANQQLNIKMPQSEATVTPNNVKHIDPYLTHLSELSDWLQIPLLSILTSLFESAESVDQKVTLIERHSDEFCKDDLLKLIMKDNDLKDLLHFFKQLAVKNQKFKKLLLVCGKVADSVAFIKSVAFEDQLPLTIPAKDLFDVYKSFYEGDKQLNYLCNLLANTEVATLSNDLLPMIRALDRRNLLVSNFLNQKLDEVSTYQYVCDTVKKKRILLDGADVSNLEFFCGHLNALSSLLKSSLAQKDLCQIAVGLDKNWISRDSLCAYCSDLFSTGIDLELIEIICSNENLELEKVLFAVVESKKVSLSVLWSRLEAELSSSYCQSLKSKLKMHLLDDPKTEAQILSFLKSIGESFDTTRMVRIENAQKSKELWNLNYEESESFFNSAFKKSSKEAGLFELLTICSSWKSIDNSPFLQMILLKMIELGFISCASNSLIQFPEIDISSSFDISSLEHKLNIETYKLLMAICCNGSSVDSKLLSLIPIEDILKSPDLLVLLFLSKNIYEITNFNTVFKAFLGVSSDCKSLKILLIHHFFQLIMSDHFLEASEIAVLHFKVSKAYLLLSDKKYLLRNSLMQIVASKDFEFLSNCNEEIQLSKFIRSRLDNFVQAALSNMKSTAEMCIERLSQ